MDRSELRRLRKAARDNNKLLLSEWAVNFENQIKQDYDRAYNIKFERELSRFIDIFCISIAYTLRYNKSTKFGPKRLPSFMEDMFVTIDMFRTGEFTYDDYLEDLEKNGVCIDRIKYSKRSNEYQEKLVKLKELETYKNKLKKVKKIKLIKKTNRDNMPNNL